MRITCPDCGAQYEVPDGVIPDDGRDVECSNCGVTWFQAHPDHPVVTPEPIVPEGPAGDMADLADEPGDEPEDESANLFDQEDEIEAALAQAENPDAEPGAGPAEPDAGPLGPSPATSAPARREIDSTVADILREELAFEERQRVNPPAGPLESRPAPGQDQPAAGSAAAALARERADRMRKGSAAPAGPEVGRVPSRRDLLPDIDEINSSLRADRGKTIVRRISDDDEDHAHDPSRRSGFSLGFATVALIAVGLVVIYANAPELAGKVPALDGALNALVATVDNVRFWLDAQVKAFTG